MRRHTLVVSDVHLATRASPADDERDRLLARTIDLARDAAGADRAHLELVLNGDLFDLDAPPERGPADAVTYDACRGTAAPTLMRRVLDAHPRVVDALRRVLVAAGGHHRVVVVPGNHDAQLALPGVRAVLSTALSTSGSGSGNGLVLRSWFHRTPDGVHVEHGHQYDPLCVMEQMYPKERPGAEGLGIIHRLEDTVGSVGTHHGQAIFAQMNPYAADPLAGVRGRDVLAALRASLMQGEMTRVLGATRDLMLVRRRVGADRRDDLWLDVVARETGAPRGTLAAHRALFAPKADASDVATAAIREYDYGADVDARLRAAMAAVARLHGARAVVTGHTHDAWLERHRPSGAWLVNAGSWAPSSLEPRGRTSSERREVVGTFAHVRSDTVTAAPGAFAVGLHTVWPNGSIT